MVVERVGIVAPRIAERAAYAAHGAIIRVLKVRQTCAAFDIAPGDRHVRAHGARMRLVRRNLRGRTQDGGLLNAEERIAAVHEIVTVGCEVIIPWEECRGRQLHQRLIVHEAELKVGCRSLVEVDMGEEACLVPGILPLYGLIRCIVETGGGTEPAAGYGTNWLPTTE